MRRWFSTHSFTVLSSRTAHARICLSRSSLISIVFIPHSYQRGRGVESLNGGAGSKVRMNCPKMVYEASRWYRAEKRERKSNMDS